MVVVPAVGAEEEEPGPGDAAADAPEDSSLLRPHELGEARPRAADRAVSPVPPVDVRQDRELGGGLPQDGLEDEVEDLPERARVDAEAVGLSLDGRAIAAQRRNEERTDVDRRGRQALRRLLRRSGVRGLGEVARDAMELASELFGVARETASGQERDALADGGRRLLAGEVDGDVGRRARGKLREPLVVECRDRSEARVLSGELSPASAGLVDLELCRQGRCF